MQGKSSKILKQKWQKSVLGLGKLPVYQDEQFRYLTEKLNGYITGAYIYNKMGP